MFKQNFINICIERGIAPTVVLKSIGISHATFSNWTDNSMPRPTTLTKIANYFGITVEDLLRDPAQKVEPEASPTGTDHPMLDARFYELLDQLTLKELRELKAQMEETIKNRK